MTSIGKIPLTQQERLQLIAVETARMSYPGAMGMGKNPVIIKGMKAALESYFRDKFPIAEVWNTASTIAKNYDAWHKARVNEIVKHTKPHISAPYVPESVAAKFLNTFMYQLMKHQEARALFPCLYLPLDSRVFSRLRQLRPHSLASLQADFKVSPTAPPQSCVASS
jgi:hypothetical protein